MTRTKFDWDWRGFQSGYVKTMKNSPEVVSELKKIGERIRARAQNAVDPGGNDFEVTVTIVRRAPVINVRATTYKGRNAEAKRRVLTKAYAAELGKGKK